MNTQEQDYLNLLKSILDNGDSRMDRTKIGTKSLFGSKLTFSLENNSLPAITTKKTFIRGAIEELLLFLKGETNTKLLEEKQVNIWKGNTSRSFLDSRNMHSFPEGSLGKMYGYQWRRFNDSVDQLANIIDLIKHDPSSRRIMVTALNPAQSHEMVLEPCHCFFQFYVSNNKLSCQWYQRSVDSFLGLPFNIISYATLTHIIAKLTNLIPHQLIFIGGDTHIYSNHFNQVKEQISRIPYTFPSISINKDLQSIKDIENLSFDDFVISNYKHHSAIKAEMAI